MDTLTNLKFANAIPIYPPHEVFCPTTVCKPETGTNRKRARNKRKAKLSRNMRKINRK